MPETRRIENYGIMKLTPEERGSNNLLIQTDVIQLPYSEYLNVRSNPPKGHYGYACFMVGEYVIDIVDIQFRRQILVDRDRYIVQLAWQEFCNSKTIAAQLGVPLPDTTVDYPIWSCKEIRFKLEPGVILNVFKSNIPPVTCSGTGISEPNIGGSPPGLPPSPQLPPPTGTPEQDKLPLAPPYEGDDDDGNTYVRPDIPPPPVTGGEVGKLYKVSIQYTGALGDLTQLDGPFYGPIRGAYVDQNAAGVRGVLQVSNQDGSPAETARRTSSVVGQPATMTILDIILFNP